VTGDQTLVHEQKLGGPRLAILALSANNWPIIKGYVAVILGGDQHRRSRLVPDGRLRHIHSEEAF
jgi:hypothetical protein